MILVGVLFANEEFCSGNKVVKHVLLVGEHAGTMPVFSELRTATQVGNGEHAAVLEPKVAVADKARGQADVEAAVAGEQCGVVSIEFKSFFVKDEHRDFGAVFRREPELLDFVGIGID